MTQKCCCSVAALEILKHKRHISVSAIQTFIEIVSIISVSVALESSHSFYERNQFMSIINADK